MRKSKERPLPPSFLQLQKTQNLYEEITTKATIEQ